MRHSGSNMKVVLVVFGVLFACGKPPSPQHGYPGNFPAFLAAIRREPPPFPFGSHCRTDEVTVFGCSTPGSKVLSICVSSDPNRPTLSYRFGTVGKPEIAFPEDSRTSLDAFRYDWYLRGFGCQNDGRDYSYLNFSRGGFFYSVYTEYVACAESWKSGVRVSKSGSTEGRPLADFSCVAEAGSLIHFRFTPIVYCPDCRDPFGNESK